MHEVCEIIGHPKYIEFNGRFGILTVETNSNKNIKINLVKNESGELRSIRWFYGDVFNSYISDAQQKLNERIPDYVFNGSPDEQKKKFDVLNLNEIFNKYRRKIPIKFYTNAKYNVLINFIKHEKYIPKTIDKIRSKLDLEPGWKIIEPIEMPSWKFITNITDFKDLNEILIDDDRALSGEVDSTRFSNGKAKLSDGTNPPIEIDCGELPMKGIKITYKNEVQKFKHTEDITKIISHIKNLMIKNKLDSKNSGSDVSMKELFREVYDDELKTS